MSDLTAAAKRECEQPKCPICGRFARKDVQQDGQVLWLMSCVSGNPIDGWSHD